jgi:Ni/Co efflux regulator RcnB
MKSTAIVLAITAASLGFSAVSSAQDNDRRGRREDAPRAQQSSPRHMDQRGQRDQDRYQRRGEYRSDNRYDRHDGYRYDSREARRNDRHEYYNARRPEFRRGGYIPREFRNRQYYVSNYRTYRLSPPPRGHQWVQVGPDYVLIAMATGLIAHIVLNH